MPKKYIADPEGSSISYDDTSLLEIPPHNKTVYFAYDEEASDFFCFDPFGYIYYIATFDAQEDAKEYTKHLKQDLGLVLRPTTDLANPSLPIPWVVDVRVSYRWKQSTTNIRLERKKLYKSPVERANEELARYAAMERKWQESQARQKHEFEVRELLAERAAAEKKRVKELEAARKEHGVEEKKETFDSALIPVYSPEYETEEEKEKKAKQKAKRECKKCPRHRRMSWETCGTFCWRYKYVRPGVVAEDAE